MADLSRLITQELLHLAEQVLVPTRFYFPSGTVPAEVSPAFDAGWANTASAVVRQIVSDGRKRGTATASVTVTGTAANPEQMLHAQYVSKPLCAQTISGNVSGQFRALESATGANATLQIGIRVVSQDGATVRATLLAVGGSTTTATTPPEFTTALTNRRLLTAGDVTPLPLTPYTCQDGDRLVIEIGHNNKSATATQTHGISFGDNTFDLPVNDTTTTAQDPWVEFDSPLGFLTQVDVLHLSDTGHGATQLINPGALRLSDVVTAQLSAGADLSKNLADAEVLHLQETVTVARDLTVSLQEALKLADTVTASLFLQAFPTAESVRIAEVQAQTLDPEQANPSEALKLADGPVTAQIVLLASLQESLRLSDIGHGAAALIGVLHITDGPVQASIGAQQDLSSSLSEALKLADTLTVARGLTVSTEEDLRIADSLTVTRELTASLSETLHVGDTVTPSLDPEQAGPSETLKLSETVTGHLTSDLGATPASEEPTHLQETIVGVALDPLLPSVALGETLTLADTVSASRTLEVAVSGESLRIAEALTAGPVINAALGNENLRIADSATGELQTLETSVSEVLRIADLVVSDTSSLNIAAQELLRLSDRVVILTVALNEILRLSDTGQGATQLIGTLRIQDGPVVVQLGSLLSAGPSESLRLADTPSVVRSPIDLQVADETVKIGYVQSEIEYTRDEYLVVADTANVFLAVPNDLSTFIAPETLTLRDVAAMNRDLEAVAAEALKLADPLAAARDLSPLVSEALKLADTLTVARDLTVATAEALTLVDGPAARTLDPEQTVLADSFRLDEALTANLGNPNDLAVSAPDETVKLTELLATARDLTAAVAESLHLQDTAAVGDGTLLLVVLTEVLTLADVAQGAADLRIGLEQEDLEIGEQTDATLGVPVVLTTEILGLDDGFLQVGMDLATDTTGDTPPPTDVLPYAFIIIRPDVGTILVRPDPIRD